MRRIKGARHAHAAMRVQGKVPGDEGRAAIAANREVRKRDLEQGKAWRVSQTFINTVY